MLVEWVACDLMVSNKLEYGSQLLVMRKYLIQTFHDREEQIPEASRSFLSLSFSIQPAKTANERTRVNKVAVAVGGRRAQKPNATSRAPAVKLRRARAGRRRVREPRAPSIKVARRMLTT